MWMLIASFFGIALVISDNAIASSDCTAKSSKISLNDEFQSYGEVALEFNREKKYVKHLLRIKASKLTDSDGVHEIITPDLKKKKFKGLLTPSGQPCSYRFEAKITGDYKDHLRLEGSPHGKEITGVASSLNLHFEDANFAGATKWKLLLPETRNFGNEIFASTLFEYLGILSPRTKMVRVIRKDASYKALMQEMIEKELLERSGRRECPLFAGDESYMYSGDATTDGVRSYPYIGYKLSNAKWASRSRANFQLAADAYGLLASNWRHLMRMRDRNYVVSGSVLANGSDILMDRWLTFEVLMMALNGTHGMPLNDRRLFFNCMENGFEPIYYDGNIDFFAVSNDGSVQPVEIKDLRLIDLAVGDWVVLAQNSRDSDFNTLRSRVSKILGLSSFRSVLNDRGMSLNEKDMEGLRLRLLGNIDLIETTMREKALGSLGVNTDYMSWNSFAQMITRQLVDEPVRFVTINLDEVSYCISNTPEECSNESIRVCTDLKACTNFLTKTYGSNTGFQFINISGRRSLNGPEIMSVGPYKIKAFGGGSFEYDSTKDLLTIDLKETGHAVLTSEQPISGSIQVMNGKTMSSADGESDRSNRWGLTGCLTLYDVRFDDVTIGSSGGECEDSLHFVSSSGSIKAIKVNRADSDAIDADFSSLQITNLFVEQAGNDCLDFSFGSYRIGEALLLGCGDKGISLGETAQLSAQTVTVDGSFGYALAVKDSAEGVVKDLVVKNSSSSCVAAYSKKQEFNGGSAIVEELDCQTESNLPLYVEKGSVIKVDVH